MAALTVLQGCRTIQLTQGYNTLIDEADYPEAIRHTWHAQRIRDRFVYAVSTLPLGKRKRQAIRLHGLLTGAVKGQFVDHKNGDGRDNRRANIRAGAPSGNNRNQRNTYGRSPYKGVDWYPRRAPRGWRARILHPDGRRINLGFFLDPADAARAYDRAALEYYGEYACTNAQIHGGDL